MHPSLHNLEKPRAYKQRTYWKRVVNPDKVTQQIKKYIFYGLTPKDLVYVGGGGVGPDRGPCG